MKIIFWGTPNFAIPILESLKQEGHEIVCVVTQPDKRRNRGKNLSASPIKKRALELNLNVITTKSIKNDVETKRLLKEINADLYIVVAFGQILPKDILELPKLGCWNCHASLLPRWRGAAPIQRSILNGDNKTGVGIMLMEEELDTGPILIEEELDIGLLDNLSDVTTKLSFISSKLIIEALKKIEKVGQCSLTERIKKLECKDQSIDPSLVIYANMINKSENLIIWNDIAYNIHKKIMGLYPNAFTTINRKLLKIEDSEPLIPSMIKELSKKSKELAIVKSNEIIAPGTIVNIFKGFGFAVATKDFPILIKRAKLEGKSSLEGESMIQQLRLKQGDLFC